MNFEFELGDFVAQKTKPELKMIVTERNLVNGGVNNYSISYLDNANKKIEDDFYEHELQKYEPLK